MGKIRWIALCWLIFLTAFSLGMYVHKSQAWPYRLLKEAKDFLQGGDAERLSLLEKMENDMNFKPSRHIRLATRDDDNWSRFNKGFESEKHSELEGLPLNPRRKNPKVFLSDKAPEGYRVIWGTMDFNTSLHGVIMLNSEGKVAHIWKVSQEGLGWKSQQDTNVFLHGFQIAPDGSIVTAFDDGNSLIKYDYCGNVVWRLRGNFHHSIEFEGENSIWTLGDSKELPGNPHGHNLLKIDYQNGKIINEIPLQKVMDANPDIDIFGILQNNGSESSTWLLKDYWHPNDVDPLPKTLEPYYPNFKAGDLLVSLRNINLIFVMDQNTLKVKWWSQGLVRRQHDPDWNNKGTITIFNNNMHRGYSKITEVNPNTYEYNTIIDGENYDFYTSERGNHQMLPSGGVLIASSEQGRIFETDAEGNIVFEFINVYGDDHEYLAVSGGRFLPKNFFKELPECK